MGILLIYLAVFVLIGIIDFRKVKNFDDFVLAGRKQKSSMVTMSLLATVIGASATMGVSSLAVRYGFAAFLWLGSGGIALILQSLLLSEKVRSLGANTLPGLAGITAGREGRIITAAVIVVSWTGIIAAQFIALSSIISLLTGKETTPLLIVLCSSVIIAYTAFGGQFSIIRTDALQFIMLTAGIALALFLSFSASGTDLKALFSYRGKDIGGSISAVKIFHLMFVVGGAYFIGPDVFSRNFTSESPLAARKAALTSGIMLLFFSIAITFIGMNSAIANPGLNENPFIFIVKNLAGPAASVVIITGLLSAIVSSTDTCIMTAAAIVENDIIGRSSVRTTRYLVIASGAISLALALFRKDILTLLTGTYSVFSPGIVFPVFAAIMAKGRKNINRFLWLSAVLCGGSLGLASNLTGKEYLALSGMAMSAVLAAASVFFPFSHQGQRDQS